MEGNVRKSAIAGSWYPGNPKALRASIHDFIAQVPEAAIAGRIVGLVVPHAGYAYSGQVAAYAYKLLEGKAFESVIVIGPSHRLSFRGVSLFNRGGYETPLGTVPVDGELADRIMAGTSLVSATPLAHQQEHSIEIQLPFLQYVLGDFSFVPLLMGDQERRTCKELAGAVIGAVGQKRVLLVGSSDLSHFHRYDQALTLDRRALAYLEKMDVHGFLNGLQRAEFEACGGGPAAVAMLAASGLGASRSKILHYANSGDVTGDRQSVVGYGALIFTADR